jgi:hypothetical protein
MRRRIRVYTTIVNRFIVGLVPPSKEDDMNAVATSFSPTPEITTSRE